SALRESPSRDSTLWITGIALNSRAVDFLGERFFGDPIARPEHHLAGRRIQRNVDFVGRARVERAPVTLARRRLARIYLPAFHDDVAVFGRQFEQSRV